MARYDIGAGEMRTRVQFQTLTTTTDTEGYPVKVWTDVFAAPVYCKWVWEHGTQVMESMRENLRETAKLTMHYTALLNNRARAVRLDDNSIWDIERINNIEDRNSQLEVVVRRSDKA